MLKVVSRVADVRLPVEVCGIGADWFSGILLGICWVSLNWIAVCSHWFRLRTAYEGVLLI